MKKLAVFTATRAEYGLLRPLMRVIQDHNSYQLQVIVSGTHLSPEFGETWKLIQEDGFGIDQKVEMLLSSDSPVAVAKSMGIGTMGFADALARLDPDCLVVLGDRYEVLAAVQAATIMRIPVAHIHGGEITEGAYDDVLRHAITKLSHWHFVACEQYRRRVIQLGESPDRVWNVGALGLENIAKEKLISLEEIGQQIGHDLRAPFFLVTFHPVTAADESQGVVFNNLISALNHYPEYQVLFTYPNADNGGHALIKLIHEYVNQQAGRAFVVASLGLTRYLSAVRACSAVIGNSSSGIIEVPSLQTPVVNIGSRQKGRLASEAVIHVGTSELDIRQGIDKAISPEMKEVVLSATNPYGCGNTSGAIMRVLSRLEKPHAKAFFDLPYQFEE